MENHNEIPSYLQRNRYGIFHFRRAIPHHLRATIGKTEIIRSLRTRDPHEAVQLARFIAIQIDRLFTEAQMGKDKNIRTDYGFTFTEYDDGSKETKVEVNETELEAILKSDLSPEQKLALLKPENKSAPSSQSNNNGVNENQTPITSQKQGITLSELFNKYNDARVAERNGDWKVPAGDITKARRLIEILGDVTCTEVTRESARSVQRHISKLPGGNNGSRYNDISVSQILSMSYPVKMSKTNLKHYMTFYSGLFNWAVDELDYIHKNPFRKLAPKKQAGEKQPRDSFTKDEIQKIFSGNMFTEYSSGRHKSHRYWAPLIALYTGARPAEIAALTTDDIYAEIDPDGRKIWIIDINTQADKTRVKTDNGVRAIPAHPALIDLGLPEYCKHVNRQGKKRLFHHLNWEDKSGYGRYIGEHFTKHLKDVGVHVPLKKVFYSFRHTMATALERADVPIHLVERLSGRSSQREVTTGEKHYISPRDAGELYDHILKLDFTDELSNVRPFMEMLGI